MQHLDFQRDTKDPGQCKEGFQMKLIGFLSHHNTPPCNNWAKRTQVPPDPPASIGLTFGHSGTERQEWNEEEEMSGCIRHSVFFVFFPCFVDFDLHLFRVYWNDNPERWLRCGGRGDNNKRKGTGWWRNVQVMRCRYGMRLNYLQVWWNPLPYRTGARGKGA